MPPKGGISSFAEEEGFEPPKAFTPCRFSRPVQSTALPLLRNSVDGGKDKILG